MHRKVIHKGLVKHLHVECHFQIGHFIFSQIIGIPMGIDPAPFCTNRYLYAYECKCMTNLIKQDKQRAFKDDGLSRFIDDMCCLNHLGEFEISFQDKFWKLLRTSLYIFTCLYLLILHYGHKLHNCIFP